MAIKTVGVIGAGQMGSGIAQVIATAGLEVRVFDSNGAQINRARGVIEGSLTRFVQKDKMTNAERDAALGCIRFVPAMADLAGVDLVIEAIIEDLEAKQALWCALENHCGPEVLFASNTSSLSIVDQTVGQSHPERMLGLHFFNPVPMMGLVEVVRSVRTSDHVMTRGVAFVRAIGKTPVTTRDESGFIVNLLLVPYLIDAVRALERGVGSIEDIDAGMRLGAGYPMGPFTLLDVVGLDTVVLIGEIMFDQHRDARYAPPPLLRRMVAAGYLGRKNGKGFYDWSGDQPVPMELGL